MKADAAPSSAVAADAGTASNVRPGQDAGAAKDEPHAIATALDAPQWPMPNPRGSRLPNPAAYAVDPAGVVVDTVTGLIWQQKVGADGVHWRQARDYCNTLRLAGASDWRLPSLIELASLVDYTRVEPALDRTAFPEAVQGNFWTSTPVAASPGEVWYLAFSTGFNYPGHQDLLGLRVRCVRSPSGRAATPEPRYAYPSPNVVHDRATGLTWQRTLDGAVHTWTEAATTCQRLSLSRGKWRLPSMKELQTIVDFARHMPAMDPKAFPGAPMEQYWTSTPLARSPSDAWYVSFRMGAVNTVGHDSPSFVRCVR